ncbi:AAA family ATPase [Jannaschia sp. M317]|nr:AAA family ATPase [Jannaschia sp. M317]
MAAIADRIAERPGARLLIAVVGPPASGKSTIAEGLVDHLGPDAVLMPMDGFHMDDRVLEARGLRPRKGAPETFDHAGLSRALDAVRRGEEVFVPVFDRSREIAIAGAQVIAPEARVVVVEGNWLLLDRPGWRDLGPWDLTIRLETPEAELRRRLEDRWRNLPEAEARAKIDGNDLPNAQVVAAESRPADVVLTD